MKKKFIKKIEDLSKGKPIWQVWSDMITMIADAIYIAGAIMHGGIAANDKHIREYDSIKVEYKDDDVGCIFDMIEKAYEDNPDQDFLGAAYMELGLGNHWTGQFFTPYNVSKMMAQMTLGTSIPEEKDFISVCDPCCGAGAMLIAAANTFPDYKERVLFCGQDIDRITGLMCYIQLSMLRCAGYVCIANSLTNPIQGITDLLPVEKEGQEYWYTPAFKTGIWADRIRKNMLEIEETTCETIQN